MADVFVDPAFQTAFQMVVEKHTLPLHQKIEMHAERHRQLLDGHKAEVATKHEGLQQQIEAMVYAAQESEKGLQSAIDAHRADTAAALLHQNKNALALNEEIQKLWTQVGRARESISFWTLVKRLFGWHYPLNEGRSTNA